MMGKFFLLIMLSLFVVFSSGCVQDSANMPNPASVYCEDEGGEIQMVATPEGSAGYCRLPDGRICEEWDYFNSGGSECTLLADYISDGQCKIDCIDDGYRDGSCFMPSGTVEGYANIGSCLIPNSANCGEEGSCYCYCFNSVGCPEDARICPDGSVVVRIPPDCEFEECPGNIEDSAAREIAEDSECAEAGILSENSTYNPSSMTWWIDLEPYEPISGCNPACVAETDTALTE